MITGSVPEGVDWFWEGSTGHWGMLLTLPPPQALRNLEV